MRQRAGWTNILEKAHTGPKQGRNVYVINSHYPLYEKLVREHRGNYYLTTIYRAIFSLNADASSGQAMNGAGTLRYMEKEDFALEYYMDDGDVLINRLHYDETFGNGIGDQSTGLYNTKLNHRGQWTPEENNRLSMDFSQKWNGSHYAAVSGKFKNKDDAGKRLIDHIKKGYGGKEIAENDVDKVIDKSNSHYSLFWVNHKEHKNLKTCDSLTSLIQQATDAKAPVNWLVHGEGAQTFEKALDILKHQPALSRLAASDQDSQMYQRGDMGLQKVIFSNPVGVNTKNLEKSCKEVGITFVQTNANPRNFRNISTGVNTAKEIVELTAKTVVSPTGITGVGLATVGYTNIDKATTALSSAATSAMSNPGLGTAAIGVGATYAVYVAGKSTLTKWSGAWRAMRAAASSTFGRGNEYWYESDKSLLDNLAA